MNRLPQLVLRIAAPGMLLGFVVVTASFAQIARQTPAVRFRPKLLTVDANEGIDLADVNRDGKLDVIAGRNWYAAPDFLPRPVRIIEDWNGYVESNGDFAWDVDRDGWIDVIAGSFLPTEVYWYRNPGSPALRLGQLWTKQRLVNTKFSQNEASFLRDLDDDGQPEWITNSWSQDNPVNVWRFVDATSDTTITLRPCLIGAEGHGHGMGFGDVNQDGREDILVSRGWYERPGSDIWTKPWTFHGDWDLGQASCPVLVRDMNGDGRNDLIWGNGHNYGLFWWESLGTGDDGRVQFKKHTIDDRFSQSHVVQFADLTGDGQEELVTGKRVRAHNGSDPGGGEMACMYYYRWNGQQHAFERFVIEEGHVGTGLQIRSGDLDGDGNMDLAVAGKDGTWILFNEGVP